jgi:hypothetical protein
VTARRDDCSFIGIAMPKAFLQNVCASDALVSFTQTGFALLPDRGKTR